jgi:hypothetical protein
VDPVSMIVGALTAGASSGVSDAASQAVKDAYSVLKSLLVSKMGPGSAGHVALDQHERNPDAYARPLGNAIKSSGADRDAAILAAARRVLEAREPVAFTQANTQTRTFRSGLTLGSVRMGDDNRTYVTQREASKAPTVLGVLAFGAVCGYSVGSTVLPSAAGFVILPAAFSVAFVCWLIGAIRHRAGAPFGVLGLFSFLLVSMITLGAHTPPPGAGS